MFFFPGCLAARSEGPEWSEETSKEWGVILDATG